MPTFDIPDSLYHWLHGGHRGISSNAIVERLTGLPCMDGWDMRFSNPSDPADLGRCIRLLIAVPELRPRFEEMRSVSPEWGALVNHWEELAALYYEELPTGRARKCYSRMRELIDGARTKKEGD
jgi:hypothetical protein